MFRQYAVTKRFTLYELHGFNATEPASGETESANAGKQIQKVQSRCWHAPSAVESGWGRIVVLATVGDGEKETRKCPAADKDGS